MAAKQLDDLWDGQVSVLNSSYEKTLKLLNDGKTKQAYDEFHVGFTQAVKKIYSEAPQANPDRFSKIGDWAAWVKGLYVATMKADKALAAGKGDDAAALLTSLRESFVKLHSEAQMAVASDYVFALQNEAAKPQPAAGEIKSLAAKLDSAKPSRNADDFAKARSQFQDKVNPILADDKVDASELPALRDATKALYGAYGMQFE